MDVNSWFTQDPEKVSPTIRGGLTIEIDDLEGLLDDCTDFNWSTKNFHPLVYFEHGVNHCHGTIELVLNYWVSDNYITRTFVGAANFKISDILPNPDWCATLKSYCVKNAASDAGRKLGRGLNKDFVPELPELNIDQALNVKSNKVLNTLSKINKIK